MYVQMAPSFRYKQRKNIYQRQMTVVAPKGQLPLHAVNSSVMCNCYLCKALKSIVVPMGFNANGVMTSVLARCKA